MIFHHLHSWMPTRPPSEVQRSISLSAGFPIKREVFEEALCQLAPAPPPPEGGASSAPKAGHDGLLPPCRAPAGWRQESGWGDSRTSTPYNPLLHHFWVILVQSSDRFLKKISTMSLNEKEICTIISRVLSSECPTSGSLAVSISLLKPADFSPPFG